MRDYDATLKAALTGTAGLAMAEVTGLRITGWHNVELPAVRHRRADLLGETADRRLVHVELQSSNQAHMARRMLEYALAIHRKFGRFAHQIVLYVGNDPLRMKRRFSGPDLSFGCTMTDIRELDAEPLLASDSLGDNVIAVLAGRGNEREAVRRILARIAQADPEERGTALIDLMVLAGLRKLSGIIETEISKMPILDDIMDHEVIGRERKWGIAVGRAEGLSEGERRIVSRLIAKRFGPIPDWATKQIENLTSPDLEKLALRILDASSLTDLLGEQA